jgi:4-diphosphocytidyl-2-C-methyl-D-erythritol kinase
MLEIAASLGSDVPFFLTGGLALCEGRGERVRPLPACWPDSMRWILLVKPAIGVATADVFRSLKSDDYTKSEETYSSLVVRALEGGEEFAPEHLYNGLERGVLERYPEVKGAREALLEAGARYARLSGSGPTLFTSFSALDKATQVQQTLLTQGYEVYLTRAIMPNEEKIRYY